jgi:hypothetical protein
VKSPLNLILKLLSLLTRIKWHKKIFTKVKHTMENSNRASGIAESTRVGHTHRKRMNFGAVDMALLYNLLSQQCKSHTLLNDEKMLSNI